MPPLCMQIDTSASNDVSVTAHTFTWMLSNTSNRGRCSESEVILKKKERQKFQTTNIVTQEEVVLEKKVKAEAAL